MIDWVAFSPLPALIGGALIGAASAMMIVLNGRVAGISGMVAGLLESGGASDRRWRVSFVAGLLLSGAASLFAGFSPQTRSGTSWPMLFAAGLLVGFGSRTASGCTSGHAVCGVSRGSPRSVAATATFMSAGFVIVYLIRHVFEKVAI